ncbi:MAG TPA: transglutaminase domain-containing protein [Dehalococcoidia bacterium]|nr:transglutaminase domain-containing protein [Dehalococcoidia bacterium]
MLGGKLIFCTILGVLLTFSLLMGACIPPGQPSNEQIISCRDQVIMDINRGQVHFNNNQFVEARECYVDAQMHISDLKVILDKASLPEDQKRDVRLATSWWSEALIGLNKLVDATEAIKTREDWLTWGPYHEIIDSLIEGRDKLAKAQSIASDIIDADYKEGIDEISEGIAIIDESLEKLQTEQMLGAVKVYTYIFKINTESVRDLTIRIVEDAASDKEEITHIFNYVRDNIKYIKDPRYTQLDFDYIQSPSQTLDRGAGDCDDHSVLLASLLESVGYSTRLCFVDTDGKEPLEADHMNVIVTIDNAEYILEATCKTCKMGEYPGKMYYESYDYAELKAMMEKAIAEARK